MYGLVLEGGGAKGSYHIGAYKALRELDVEIFGVTGTSIGAINGALIVQDNWQQTYDLWYNIDPSQLFEIEPKIIKELRDLNINQENIRYLLNRVRQIFNNRGINIKKIRAVLNNNIDEKIIRSSLKDFGIVTINLSSMKGMELFVEDIPKGKLLNYIMASSYLPAFKMEKMDGNLFLDGGFYDNLPISLLSNKGYKDIIAVRTYGIGRIRKINKENLNITYISPREDLGSILDFDQERIRYNINLGYYDTLKIFKDLKGNKYYFNISNIDDIEDFSIKIFLQLNESQINKIAKIFNFKEPSGRRIIFEKLIPKLANLFNLDNNYSYQDILILLLEYVAAKYGIERFEIYQLDYFINKIMREQERQKMFKRNIPGFIINNDLLSKAVKEEILDNIVDVIFARK